MINSKVPSAYDNITGSDDHHLVEQYRQSGDLSLLGKLYAPYMHLVYGSCLKYLKDTDAAKDAVMNIFEDLVTKLRHHRVENFRSWLFVVTRNHCLMQLRKESRMQTTEIPISIMQSEEELHLNNVLEKEALLQALEECLDTLPPEQQHTVRLFYLENKCYNDIALDTGLEWNKVRSQIQNGRRNLRNCMDRKNAEH